MDERELAAMEARVTEGQPLDWRQSTALIAAVREAWASDTDTRERVAMLLGIMGEYGDRRVPTCVVHDVLVNGCRPSTPAESAAMHAALMAGSSPRKDKEQR